MKLSSLGFFQVFNFKTHESRGRIVMLISAVMDMVISYLTAGVFYTGFLIGNNIDIVNVGIISFLPYIASCFSIFAPMILEKLKRRKWYLFWMRTLYFTVNIMGITLLPVFVKDPTLKVVGFGCIVFIASLINALITSGYTVWHLNFIPDDVRAKYFSFQQITSMIFAAITLLTSSSIADALSGTPHELEIITTFRYIAYVLAIIEMVIMLAPKEYSYPQTEKVRFKNVFVLPFKNKQYMFTMSIIAMWQFSSSLTSLFSYYLLNDCNIPYIFINSMDAAYAVFLIVFSPFWVKILKKWSWLKTFAITAIMHLPTNIMYGFATEDNYFWLVMTVRLVQHVLGVGMNLAYANIQYIALPEEGRSNYLVFYTLIINITAFLGSFTATGFIDLTENITFNIFGIEVIGVQLLMMIFGCLQGIIGLYILKTSPKFGLMPKKLKN